MRLGPDGYVPEPYFFTETLRTQTRFNDPLQDSLFSKLGSVENYKEWTRSNFSSGRSSPLSVTPDPTSHTLLVRSSRPFPNSVAMLLGEGAQNHLEGRKVADSVYEAHLPSLVTPKCHAPGGSVTK